LIAHRRGSNQELNGKENPQSQPSANRLRAKDGFTTKADENLAGGTTDRHRFLSLIDVWEAGETT